MIGHLVCAMKFKLYHVLMFVVPIVTVSLVLVGVARLRCYAVFWDDYASNQGRFSSLVNPLGLRDTVFLEKMLVICHRWAIIRINITV